MAPVPSCCSAPAPYITWDRTACTSPWPATWRGSAIRCCAWTSPAIGDSEPRAGEPENAVYSRTALQDVRDGLDFLRREYGARDVRALGLCSGAYHVFKGAVARLPIDAAVNRSIP